MFKRKKRGQNLAEYSILIALIVAAAVAMQTYIKRGWSGRVKDIVDAPLSIQITNADTINMTGDQFNPYNAFNSNAVVSSKADYDEQFNNFSAYNRENINERTVRYNGAQESWTFSY